MEIVLTLFVAGILICLVGTIIAATKWCGATWFQRNGACLAILSVALGVFSTEIQPDMAIAVLKPVLNSSIAILALLGAFVGAFGEVIWNVIHRGNRSFGDVMRQFVNS